MAAFSEGSVQRAGELAEPELWSFRRDLLTALTGWPLQSVRLAESLEAFVNEAGKEASARRRRLRQAIVFAHDLFREALRGAAGVPLTADADIQQAVQAAPATWADNPELIVAILERCLEALAQVDRNANQSTLIACWLDDLARMIDTGRFLFPLQSQH